MAIFNGKEVVMVFCVDYSASVSGKIVIYEIQHLNSANYLVRDDAQQAMKRTRSQEWLHYFRKISEPVFFVDLPNSLEANKVAQRIFFANAKNTAALSPPFLVLPRIITAEDISDTLKNEITTFIKKYNKKVVLKASGSDGKNNIFLRNEKCIQDAVMAAIAFYEQNTHCVMEAEIMHPPSDPGSFSSHSKPGVYYRDIVFFHTETNETKYIEVYEEVLDTTISTNSHDTPTMNAPCMRERGYLLLHSPETLRLATNTRKGNFQVLYATKERAFRNIGQELLSYLMANSHETTFRHQKMGSLKNFLSTAHHNNWEQYHAFLKYGAGHKFIAQHHEFAFFPRCSKSEKCYGLLMSNITAIAEQISTPPSARKHFFISKIMYFLEKLAPLELFALKHEVLSAKVSPNFALRDLWLLEHADEKNPRYGNTAIGTSVLHAITEAIDDPIIQELIAAEYDRLCACIGTEPWPSSFR